MPRLEGPARAGLDDVGRIAQTTTLVGPAGEQRIALPAIAAPTGRLTWREAPHPWGSDAPGWAE